MYRRAAGALAVTLMVLLGASSPARADMRPTVDNASPSRAAGAQTVYAIAFTTERRLGRDTSSAITLAFPAGTGFAGYGGSAVFDTDVSTTRSIGACGGARTLTVSCGLDLDQAIPAGHHVRVVLNGITNPPAGTPCVTVSTSSPTQAAVHSAPFSVVAANPVSAVTADNSTPTRAAGGRTVYAVGFTTSRTGGISRAANSAVELVFPAGTTFAGYGGGAVYDTDVSTTTSIGSCGGVATLTVVCGLDVEQAIPASHHVVVVLNGIANPPAGSSHVAVATSSDHGLVDSASYGVLPAQAVSGVSVALGSRAVSALTQYTVEFVTSAGGGLSRDANSAISVVFPPGTSFGSSGGSAVYDVTAGGPAIGSCGGGVALTVTCGLSLGQSVPAGDRVRVTFAGVGNPSTAGGRTVNVSTTSDVGADSAPYSIAAAAAPPDTTVTGGPSGTVSGNTTTFTFASTVPGSTFVCRLDGPGGPIGPEPCTSPMTYSGLRDGTYTFSVTAIDPAGNADPTPGTRSFTLATAQSTPIPEFHKNVVVTPVSGTVRVKLPGTKRFVALKSVKKIPLGATIDGKAGRLRLSSMPKPGGTPQTVTFSGGIFRVTQPGGITDLRLNEALAACPRRGQASAAVAKKKRKPKTRRLWGDGSGAFRTRGQYSAATVRGTKWLVQDSCAGTLTRVARGVVSVRDRIRHRTIVVRAGHRYLARPPR